MVKCWRIENFDTFERNQNYCFNRIKEKLDRSSDYLTHILKYFLTFFSHLIVNVLLIKIGQFMVKDVLSTSLSPL